MRSLTRCPTAVLASLLLGAHAAAATPLSLDDAIALALRDHPSVRGATAQQDAARARVGVAMANYLPSLILIGLGRTDLSNYAPLVVGTPQAGMATTFPFQASALYTSTLDLHQVVIDSGRTGRRVAVARDGVAAAGFDVQATRAAVELSVIDAYFSERLAGALRDVQRDAVTQAEGHVARARKLFDAGIKPQLDVLQARSQLGQAHLDALAAGQSLAQASLSLANAVGLEGDGGIDTLEPSLEALPEERLPIGELVAEAHRARPDIASARWRLTSADDTRRARRADYLPIVTGDATLTAAGSDAHLAPVYDVAATLTIQQPLFEGLSTYHAIEEAEALERLALTQLATVELRARFEVASAQRAVSEARDAGVAARELLEVAQQQARTAATRYESGVATFLDVRAAEAQLVLARAQDAQASNGLARNRAVLLRALGRSRAGARQ